MLHALPSKSEAAPLGDLQDFANCLKSLLDAVQREIEHDRRTAKEALATASSLVQDQLDRLTTPRMEEAASGGLARWQMARVQSYVAENLERSIQARDLCSVARRSKAHFSRAFKRSFGMTPHEYVLGRRLKRASELMLMTADCLSGIALACGFTDQAHLCKQFKKAYGESPAAWRRARSFR